MKIIEECNKCGSTYELTGTRLQRREKDSLICEVCGFEYYIYNEAKSWVDKLIQRNDNHININT